MDGLSIVVVDDDADFRAALARGLRAAGHAVREADGAAGALRSLEAATPDVLITDIFMAEGDGLELITAVKALARPVPIVVMSGRGRMGSVDLLDLATRLGAHASLGKPFSMDEMLTTLDSLFPASCPSRGRAGPPR